MKRPLTRWSLALLSLTACASSAPQVDEERIARRVVALLRREGLVVAARDGGRAAPRSDDDSAQEADDDPSTAADEGSGDEASGDDASSDGAQAQPEAQAAPAPTPAPPAARASSAHRAIRERPAVTVAAPAVALGDGPDARVCVPLAGAPSQGPTDALVTLVAFVDTQCPFSARLFPSLRAIQSTRAREVRLVVMHRPLVFHHDAWGGAVFAEVARAQGGDARFFDAMDLLFARQRSYDRAGLDELGRALGLDVLRLADALDDPAVGAFDRAVAASDAVGEAARVQGTPHTLINGRRVAGAVSREALDHLVDAELDLARRALARHVARAALHDTLCRAEAPAPLHPPQPRNAPGVRP